MTPFGWQILAAMAFVGHFGLHLALYNRLNSFGWPRPVLKTIEKTLFVEMLLTPLAIAWWHTDLLHGIVSGSWQPADTPAHLQAYAVVCLASWIVFGIPWLVWRPIFRVEWADAPRVIELVHVEQTLGRSLARTWHCQLESRLPLNQIFDLAIEQIELPVRGMPDELDGYRVAQLSDLHLTGDIDPDYYRYAVSRAVAWEPELFAVTGDIIDVQPCIDWLPGIFSPAEAVDGCYFILGNHDTRVVDSWQTRRAMDLAGWTDLGSHTLRRDLRGVPTRLIGNEFPWFGRPDLGPVAGERFRLLLSHSPDQIGWARRHGVHVMLAGHTHGGQGRLPLVGPLLSPSWHGSRYASGDFDKPPTTMHVSRGLGGVHLMRIGCRPELSLITLRSLRPHDTDATR